MMLTIAANSTIALYLGLEARSRWRSTSWPRCRSIVTICIPPKPASNISCSARCRSARCSTASRSSTAIRQHRLPGDRHGGWTVAPIASSAWCSAWSSCWPVSPSRFRRCPSICGRPTSTKARRRRSPPSLPPPRRWRRWRCSWSRSRLRADRARLAADRRLHLYRLDGAGRLCRDRPRNIKRLMAYSSSAIWATRWSGSPPTARRACAASPSTC